MTGAWSKTPTSGAPLPVACEGCGVDVSAVWAGTGWRERTRCEACATRAQSEQSERERLARWRPALLAQVGPLHYEQQPVALLAPLHSFALSSGDPDANTAVYLYGRPGTGKTQQLVWLAQRVLRVWAGMSWKAGDCPVIYVRIPALLHDLRADGQRLAVYQQTPWLLLDEVGAEELTPWGMAQINEILEHRLRWRLATAFAGNVSIRDLLEGQVVGWDERMVSRLVQMVGQDDDGALRGHYQLQRQMRIKGGM